ncbi:UNVERIFIED_CONTAM: hypothetical protein GTU68_004356 [Idotea baltica]|nr:hypothetical protein [Idotea baltica]
MLSKELVIPAILKSFTKCNPKQMVANPVMFCVEVVTLLCSVYLIDEIVTGQDFGFTLQVVLWLWFTILFANFAEAIAEGRGKAQADTLKAAKSKLIAIKVDSDDSTTKIDAESLRIGDVVLVETNCFVPCDGDVVEGMATIDESAITGESEPVVKESGSDNSAVTAGRAVESSGSIDLLLLDKTGTITLGNRFATEFIPVGNVDEQELAYAAWISSLSDETPEGKSIVKLAEQRFEFSQEDVDLDSVEIIPFSAYTRMSGIDYDDVSIRKGAISAIEGHLGDALSANIKMTFQKIVETISEQGGTPLAVAKGNKLLGVIYLKDIIKPNINERFAELRKMGVQTVMITGDNPLTAASIAAEAGVDDYIAQASPKDKLDFIIKAQKEGKTVAMCGDGTNDAPALAQADVGIAMASGTSAAREAGNMVDLDSDPKKIIEIVKIGKQILVTRGALTTFSITNDIAKYFVVIPALFVTAFPSLDALNVMHLHSSESAILSAVIFNALIIIFLIPMALIGVKSVVSSAQALLRKNMLVYGLGGVIVPFIGIKLIDMCITMLHLV